VKHFRLICVVLLALIAGPSLWNSLPDSLGDLDLGADLFRRLLKMHLFTLYWSI